MGVVRDGHIGNGIGVTGVDLSSFQWLGHVRFDIHKVALPVNTCGKSSNRYRLLTSSSAPSVCCGFRFFAPPTFRWEQRVPQIFTPPLSAPPYSIQPFISHTIHTKQNAGASTNIFTTRNYTWFTATSSDQDNFIKTDAFFFLWGPSFFWLSSYCHPRPPLVGPSQ